MISNEQLIQLGKEGFIPGPDETQELFLARVKLSKKNVCEIYRELGEVPPFAFQEKVISSHWDWPRSQLQRLFDINPRWISAYLSNKRLPLWNGGMAWVVLPCSLPTFSFIQLRKKRLFCSYEEVLAHEATHAVRLMYNEPIFEEFFAYLSSSKNIRKIFGPLVRRVWEPAVFLSLLTVGFWGEIFFDSSFFFLVRLCAFAWLSLGLARLARLRFIFSRAFRKIEGMLKDKSKALAVIYRLTDREIFLFSKFSSEKILRYCIEQETKSLRWKQIMLTYYRQ